jgi:hypothetical protein
MVRLSPNARCALAPMAIALGFSEGAPLFGTLLVKMLIVDGVPNAGLHPSEMHQDAGRDDDRAPNQGADDQSANNDVLVFLHGNAHTDERRPKFDTRRVDERAMKKLAFIIAVLIFGTPFVEVVEWLNAGMPVVG